MRNVNALAYTLFSENLNVAFSPEAIEAYTEIQGAGGHSAIVRVMRDLGLHVVTLKAGRDVLSHTCLSAPQIEPKEVAHHYAKALKRNVPVVRVTNATATALDAIDRAIASTINSPDYNVPVLLVTSQSDEPEVATSTKRKSRAKKSTVPARELEMHE